MTPGSVKVKNWDDPQWPDPAILNFEKKPMSDSDIAQRAEIKTVLEIARTQYSFSTNPDLNGAPTGHTLPVRVVRLSARAGFIVVCGDIKTMPGLAARAVGESS